MDDAIASPLMAAHYTGDGSTFIVGVPARDMTADEWLAVREDLRALGLAMGLYVPIDGGHAGNNLTQVSPEGVTTVEIDSASAADANEQADSGEVPAHAPIPDGTDGKE